MLLGVSLIFQGCDDDRVVEVDVLVLGGGTGGTAAAIASARMEVSTMLIEEGPWLGGMLTSAGVSAIDGNHYMPAGIWGEFRDSLRQRYGGAENLATGWVSFTLFEPKIGAEILDNITGQLADNLIVEKNYRWQKITDQGDYWEVTYGKEGASNLVRSRILVDGTDLGDIAAEVGCEFDVGMDSRDSSGEGIAPLIANDMVQDLTHVAILQDYSPAKAPLVARSPEYNLNDFICSCDSFCTDSTVQTHPCKTMLTYAKLPNEKYLINWPIFGNDYYVNMVPLSLEERSAEIENAKNRTLDFIYFIQNELGFDHLGLADEFPTEDKLALIPYHREGRRVDGLERLNINHILSPFDYELYRTGIAVGDYPIDHHHGKNLDVPEIEFPPVPSFNIPMGCLIPRDHTRLLIADKAISVTNIVNGASRLQPVILQVGQAAGVMAAICVKSGITTHDLPARQVQEVILNQGGYIMPYYDVPPEHAYFGSIQKVGATGLLKGEGEPHQWANRTWFYPDSLVPFSQITAIEEFFHVELTVSEKRDFLTAGNAVQIISQKNSQGQTVDLNNYLNNERMYDPDQALTRGEWAVILDRALGVFEVEVGDGGGL